MHFQMGQLRLLSHLFLIVEYKLTLATRGFYQVRILTPGVYLLSLKVSNVTLGHSIKATELV